MKYDYMAMSDELPAKPTGWTQVLAAHINAGPGRHIASFTIYDPNKREMPFSYGYTESGAKRGFRLPGVEPQMSWKELRAIWPIWIRRARAKQRKLTA